MPGKRMKPGTSIQSGRPSPAGEVLTVTYAHNHTIDNLDSAAGTTIPIEDEEYLCIGAAGFALTNE